MVRASRSLAKTGFFENLTKSVDFQFRKFRIFGLSAIWPFSYAQGPRKSWLHLVVVWGLNLVDFPRRLVC